MPLALDRRRIRANMETLQHSSLARSAVDADVASRPSSRTSGVLTESDEPSPASDRSHHRVAAHEAKDGAAAASSARRERPADLPGVVMVGFDGSRHRYPAIARSLAELREGIRALMFQTGRLAKGDARVVVPVGVDGPFDDAPIEDDAGLERFLAGQHVSLLPLIAVQLREQQEEAAAAPQARKKAAPPAAAAATRTREVVVPVQQPAPPSPPPKPLMHSQACAADLKGPTASTAVATEPQAPTSSTACGPSRAPSPENFSDALWHGTFVQRDATKATIADLRMEAIDRFCASRTPGGATQDLRADDLEITLRNAASKKPLLLSRDVRRCAAQESDDGSVAVEAFVYRAPSPRKMPMPPRAPTPPPTPSPPPVADSPVEEPIVVAPRKAVPPAPAAAADNRNSIRLDDDDDEGAAVEEPKKKSAPPVVPPVARVPRGVTHDTTTPPTSARGAPQRPLMGVRGGPMSPPDNSRAAGRACVRIPITYLGATSELRVPVSRQPALEEVVRDAIACFDLDAEDPRDVVARASLSYVRAAIGPRGKPTLVTMADDGNVAGLVWEALERDRQGDPLKEMELTLAIRRTVPRRY